jgi:hypothetical protein
VKTGVSIRLEAEKVDSTFFSTITSTVKTPIFFPIKKHFKEWKMESQGKQDIFIFFATARKI